MLAEAGLARDEVVVDLEGDYAAPSGSHCAPPRSSSATGSSARERSSAIRTSSTSSSRRWGRRQERACAKFRRFHSDLVEVSGDALRALRTTQRSRQPVRRAVDCLAGGKSLPRGRGRRRRAFPGRDGQGRRRLLRPRVPDPMPALHGPGVRLWQRLHSVGLVLRRFRASPLALRRVLRGWWVLGCSCGAVASWRTAAACGRRCGRKRRRSAPHSRSRSWPRFLSSAAPEGLRWWESSVPACGGRVRYEVRSGRSRFSRWPPCSARRSRVVGRPARRRGPGPRGRADACGRGRRGGLPVAAGRPSRKTPTLRRQTCSTWYREGGARTAGRSGDSTSASGSRPSG